MQGFAAFLKTLGVGRIIAMGAVTIALVGFFSYLILRATSPAMTTLFTDLSVEETAGRVIKLVSDRERDARR